MARWGICMCALWMVGCSACAYAQSGSASQRTQVVLIARLPDTFGVNSKDAIVSATSTPQGESSAAITLHAVGQLISGTSATTACFVRNSGQAKVPAVSPTLRLSSERNVPDTPVVESSCNGSFRLLAGPADSIAIETQDLRRADAATHDRLDVFFSIF